MKKLPVRTGEYKGKPMFQIFKTEDDAERSAKGERIFPAFSCGGVKAQHALNHLKELYEFCLEHGEMPVDWSESFQEFVERVGQDAEGN